ncbi:MAG: hypothetical protein F2718_06150 [Actinobacteria bacterium]|uniref:Unannotated protein n=1 Tax=freshwater metagenome TaxID=449393 RepID=A0A6J6W910_9ZZZZ|nr:hypothetical protein [Actinomycetota bacterium]
MRTGITKVLATGLLVLITSASLPGIAQAAIALPGGTCAKVNTKTKIATIAYTCTKNAKTKKLTWTRTSPLLAAARCASIKSSYTESLAGYDSAVKQLNELEAKLNEPSLTETPSPQLDNLRAAVKGMKAVTLPLLKSLVDDAGAEYKAGCVK